MENDTFLDILIWEDTVSEKLSLLTDWEMFVICLYLLGWPLSEIAGRAGLKRQTVSWTFRKSKQKMGVTLNGQGN